MRTIGEVTQASPDTTRGRQGMPPNLLPGLASAQFQGVGDSTAAGLTAHSELEHHEPMVHKQGMRFLISVIELGYKQTIAHGPVSV